jgi:phage-related protein
MKTSPVGDTYRAIYTAQFEDVVYVLRSSP